MARKQSHELLSELHDLLVDETLERIRSGEASAKDREFALALVKNSNISAVPTRESALGRLSGKLDFSAMSEKVIPLPGLKDAEKQPRPSAG